MGVVISKPAINIREQLTELKAQQGYEERQFHFDNLVTNGTFDTDLTGWTLSASTPPTWNAAGTIQFNSDGATFSDADQSFTTVVGATYQISVEMVGTAQDIAVYIGNSQGSFAVLSETVVATGTSTYYFVAEATTTWLRLRDGSGVSGINQQIDNVSVYTSDGTGVAFTMPKGWKPLHVYDDGVLQREGSAEDYEVTFDGFNYYVKPTVANPGARNTVIGVRA